MASPFAAGLVAEKGYKNIRIYVEGISGWVKAGYPLNKDESIPRTEIPPLTTRQLQEKLKDYYISLDAVCKHEFVLAGLKDYGPGISTLDVAKRIIDYGYHPPTIYFPLIVDSAIMIEPTETESVETLDAFIEAMIAIAKEAVENPEVLKSAPHNTPVRRVDDVKAARTPVLKWSK